MIASSLNGFSRKSNAPSFIASTASGTSPCPVMTITGICTFNSLIRRNRSMPVISGMRMSVTMQPCCSADRLARNEAAELVRGRRDAHTLQQERKQIAHGRIVVNDVNHRLSRHRRLLLREPCAA